MWLLSFLKLKNLFNELFIPAAKPTSKKLLSFDIFFHCFLKEESNHLISLSFAYIIS